jgi:hypothetical protein
VPIVYTGSLCARRGCPRPVWKDGLCSRCWRLARLFGRDPQMFAFEPLHGYRGARDAPQLPWEHWEAEAGARGVGLAELIGESPAGGGSDADPPPR